MYGNHCNVVDQFAVRLKRVLNKKTEVGLENPQPVCLLPKLTQKNFPERGQLAMLWNP